MRGTGGLKTQLSVVTHEGYPHFFRSSFSLEDSLPRYQRQHCTWYMRGHLATRYVCLIYTDGLKYVKSMGTAFVVESVGERAQVFAVPRLRELELTGLAVISCHWLNLALFLSSRLVFSAEDFSHLAVSWLRGVAWFPAIEGAVELNTTSALANYSTEAGALPVIEPRSRRLLIGPPSLCTAPLIDPHRGKMGSRYDDGRDGYLDLGEMKRMMEKLGAPQTHLGLKSMIAEVDEDGDSKISFREVTR
uniref:EF-hand domain-containing protein n=1 Tax=Timema shepardi TaxID=629360 RepID=A0A7R9B5G0_TIMSH|nr:unnamed protein product [Timema shepardi]